MKKRIRINSSKSPFNFLKRKSDKRYVKKREYSVIDKIDKKSLELGELFDENEISSMEYQTTSKMNILLKMMYLDDVDSEYVKTKMNVSNRELENLVGRLIDMGLIKVSSDDEVELTREGIYFITSNDLELY